MNKCDFCRHGPKRSNECCFYRGTDVCDTAAFRYMKVLMNKDNRTTTQNKNICTQRAKNYL